MRDCPICGEPDPIYYPPEGADEHGMWSCPECGWEVGDDMEPNHNEQEQR